MDKDLLESVKSSIKKEKAPSKIKAEMVEQGFLEEDIERALNKVTDETFKKKRVLNKKRTRLFGLKEVLDRIGFGFVPPQFINILFSLAGANLFIIGLVNGIKSVVSSFSSVFLKEYAKISDFSNKVISSAGIIFGFSFLFMAWATFTKNIWLFSTALIVGSAGIVVRGDFHKEFFSRNLKKERRNHFLRNISYYGVLIAGVGMLVSAWFIDQVQNVKISFLTFEFVLDGYLLSFEITAFAFIISGYLLSRVGESSSKKSVDFWKFVKRYVKKIKNSAVFHGSEHVFLFSAIAVSGLLEVLGNSYYGIFIYRKFNSLPIGGFMTVALELIFFQGLLFVGLLGPVFSSKIKNAIGLTPTLVFGAMLMAIMPLTLVFNPELSSIAAANAFSVAGSAMVGFSQSLLARKLMSGKERKRFFASVGLFMALPYLLLVPVGAYIAQTFGFEVIFSVVGFGFLLLVVPLYFILVALGNNAKL